MDALSLQLTFSSDYFLGIIGQWSAQELSAYLSHYYFDFVYPLWYGLLLWELLKKCHLNSLWMLPLIAGLCDEIENLCDILAIFKLTPHVSVVIFVGALAAWIKWLTLGFIVITLLVCYFKFKIGYKR